MRSALPVIVSLTALVASFASAHAADQDRDLDLIPPSVQQSPPPAAPAGPVTATQHNYLEQAFSYTPMRGALAVPFPPPAPSRWEDRLFLDSRDEWRLTDSLTLHYSGRLNLRAANDLDFPSHENIRNELREAFVSWHSGANTWIDFGRINVKSGVALGYNPTDFFRSRAVVEPLTADPAVLREDRLGTLMLLGQHVFSWGSVTAAYAPKVTLPTAIYSNTGLPSVDPMLDRTNAQNRFVLKVSPSLHDALSLDGLLYHAGNRTQFGANVTESVGQQTVVYLEWAGGVRPSLAADALNYGRQTGTLPRQAPAPLPVDTASRFQNDLSVGFSYVPAGARLTLNFEYHYHQAGFTAQDWRNWFAAGSAHGDVAGLTRELWYIRSYALDQQQPMSQHNAFIRADWQDAFVRDLEITALGTVSLQDGSGLLQATADYYLSARWTVGGLASISFGGRRTEFGSLPQAGAVLVRLVRYL